MLYRSSSPDLRAYRFRTAAAASTSTPGRSTGGTVVIAVTCRSTAALVGEASFHQLVADRLLNRQRACGENRYGAPFHITVLAGWGKRSCGTAAINRCEREFANPQDEAADGRAYVMF